jgi:competence protein ComEC
MVRTTRPAPVVHGLDPASALAFVIGVCLPPLLPRLLALSWWLAGLALALIILLVSRRLWPLAALLIGFVWASHQGQAALDLRLDEARAGQDLPVSGLIVDLPRNDLQPPRFDLLPDASSALGGRIRLSWFNDAPALVPGQRFEGMVRLRAPRGLENPGGFDYGRYALEQRLAATGYVRTGVVSEPDSPGFAAAVDRLRARVADEIDQQVADPQHAGLLRALAVGDQRGLDDAAWDALRITGTGHLIAISGLHVGLVAAFGAWLLAGLYMIWPRLALRIPRLTLCAVGALAAASAYSLLAGWSLPVQRTLVMIVVVLLARMLKRQVALPQSLLLAAVVVLVWDPLSVLGAGFWLSFLGVAGLMWALPDAHRQTGIARSFGRAQLAMSLGLLPITIAFFGQGSVVGPLANLIAVPWITFVIVPLLLLAVLALGIVPTLGQGLLKLAALILQPLWHLLEWMTDLPGAAWFFAEPSAWAVGLALLGAIWLFLPRGAPLRALGLLMFLPLLIPKLPAIAQGDARISMFDVGQGLSVLVQTREHTLLFDAGARSRSGFDIGEVVVVPGLRALGVRRLDRLVLSNLDADHAGGREAVLRAFPMADVQIGIDSDPAPRCEAGTSWQWDGVRFEFLHPPEFFPDRGNDSSCVLRVQTNAGVALLTGDIGAVIESSLLRADAARLRADLVFVPHHGSRSSSSPAFVAATGAQLAFNSAGRDNRYGHPHPEVRARWQDAGAEWVASDEAGFSSVLLSRLETVERWRLLRPRYWH